MRALILLAALLALQFLPGVGVGEAQAGCTGNQCDTKQEAYAAAWASAQAKAPSMCTGLYGPPSSFSYSFNPARYWEISVRIYCTHTTTGSVDFRGGSTVFQFPTTNGGCPVGTSWDETTKTCFSSAACLAHNAEPGFKGVGDVTRPFEQACIGGCNYQVQSPYSVVKAGSSAVVNGTFEFTGDACTATVPDINDPLEQVPTPQLEPTEAQEPPITECWGVNGVTICVKKDGSTCYPALPGSGRQICWRPGETGEKVDGPILQKRVGGVVVGQPGKTPPYGAMWEPAENGVEIMAEYGGFRDDGNGGKVATPPFTTTTKNYQADTGTNAGGDAPDQGENADGSPGSSAGNKGPGGTTGGASGDGGSASGGDDCDSPPICTGDVINCEIVDQIWRSRCSEGGRAVGGGGACAADGTPLEFTCSGDAILCAMAKTQQEQACADQAHSTELTNMAGADDGLAGVTEETIFGDGEGGGEINEGLLGNVDVEVCPTGFVLLGEEIELDDKWWLLANMIGWLMAAVATLWIVGKLGE